MADGSVKPIVLSDESVNVYGYRVLTAGIDLSRFKTNPVMLYNHLRATNWKDYPPEHLLPIGKWVSVKKENGRLVATPEFDMDDDFAKKVAGKYEKGYLNAASVHIDIVKISEDPKDMVPGQIRATVTKSILKEGSITDIPGNGGCVKLTYLGNSVMLNGEDDLQKLDSLLPRLTAKPTFRPVKKTSSKMNLELIKTTLELGGGATDAEVLGAIKSLQNKAARLSGVEKELSDLKQQQKTDRVTALLDDAIKAGKLTAKDRETWTALASSDYDNTKKVLDGMTAMTSLNDKIEGTHQPEVNTDLSAQFDEYLKSGKLADIKKNDPVLFAQLSAAKSADLRARGVIG